MEMSVPRGRSGALLRRSFVAGSAAAAMVGTWSNAAEAAAPLAFWQFYAPGGPVRAQADWFLNLVRDWNAAHDPKLTLQYVPTDQYMNGSKLQTSFASGEGPDIFLIRPGDFLRYCNADVLLDLTRFIEPAVR